MVPETLQIFYRPDEIEVRLIPGHWGGDLIKGAFNRLSVATLVERKTRVLVPCKINGNSAEAVLGSFTCQMKRLPAALRQFMPKGTDLTGVSQTMLNDVAALMNNRPRKTLGWKAPAEAMAKELAAFKSNTALET